MQIFQSSNITKLSHLDLSKTNIIDSQIPNKKGTLHCNLVTYLDLSYCNLDITKLSKLSLPSFAMLKHLNLSHNVITDQGADILSAMILNNNGLKHLDLCDCNLQTEAVRIVANSLQRINITYIP